MTHAVRSTREASSLPQVIVAEPWHDEDSINLIDLWLVLVRRRKVVFTTLGAALLAGLFGALLLPNKYAYTSAIEIGTTIENNGAGMITSPIEKVDTVLAKIKESYIPQAQQRWAQSHPGDDDIYKIDARIPKGSELIVIEAKGTEEQGPAFISLLDAVVGGIKADHQRVMNLDRANLEANIAKARLTLEALTDPSTLAVKKKALEVKLLETKLNQEELQDPRTLALPRQKLVAELAQGNKRLADLQDEAELIKARYQRLAEIDKLLKKQIDDLEQQINTALERRQQAIKDINNESSAMTMLMIDNELQQNRTRLAALQERLFVSQQDLRQELEDKIAANQREQDVQRQLIAETQRKLDKLALDNQRAQQRQAPLSGEIEEQIARLTADHKRAIAKQQQTIQLLKAQLQNLRETRALSAPLQSAEPTGPGKKVILILALFLGLFLGIFAAFFAEFLGKARQQLAETPAER